MWSFAMYGSGQHAIVFGYDDLTHFHPTSVSAAFYCAAEPHHTEHLLSGEWQGVALADLMTEAQIQPDVTGAIIYSSDGTQLALPMAWLEHAVLANKLNGKILTMEQGFPVRLIVPGLTACAMPRWVERIEWVTETVNPPMYTENVALITSPRSGDLLSQYAQIQGLAIAVNRSLSSLEISIDDGDWFSVPIQVEPNQVKNWSLDWTPPGAGQYRLRIRPSLSSSMQSVTITVS